jgi:hypothetical protein
MSPKRADVLERIERMERLVREVRDGLDVRCDVCGLPLVYYGLKSGEHPGVFCPTGCTSILLELRER